MVCIKVRHRFRSCCGHAPRQVALATVATLALLGQATTPLAQPAPAAHRADPLNAQAPVPRLVHTSAFAKYRRLADVPVGSWREANDNVTRIGGWRAYAREASQPEAPMPAAPDAAASAPGSGPTDPAKAMPPGHRGHDGQKPN